MRRPRSPVALYGLVMATSGVYAFFWALSLMEDLNELLGAQRFKVAAFRRIVVILLFAYALSVLYLMSTIGSTLRQDSALRESAFVMAFGLIAFLVWLVVRINQEIGSLTSEPRTGTGQMIWLTVLFFSSLPMLQADVNRLLARGTRAASPAGEGR